MRAKKKKKSYMNTLQYIHKTKKKEERDLEL